MYDNLNYLPRSWVRHSLESLLREIENMRVNSFFSLASLSFVIFPAEKRPSFRFAIVFFLGQTGIPAVTSIQPFLELNFCFFVNVFEKNSIYKSFSMFCLRIDPHLVWPVSFWKIGTAYLGSSFSTFKAVKLEIIKVGRGDWLTDWLLAIEELVWKASSQICLKRCWGPQLFSWVWRDFLPWFWVSLDMIQTFRSRPSTWWAKARTTCEESTPSSNPTKVIELFCYIKPVWIPYPNLNSVFYIDIGTSPPNPWLAGFCGVFFLASIIAKLNALTYQSCNARNMMLSVNFKLFVYLFHQKLPIGHHNLSSCGQRFVDNGYHEACVFLL